MIESVALVLEVLTILFCLSGLFGRKIVINIYTIALIIMYVCIFIGINSYDFPIYISYLAYIMIFIYCLFLYRKNMRITLINLLLSFAISSVLQLIYYVPVFFVLRNSTYFLKTSGLFINIAAAITIFVLCKRVTLKEVSKFICQKSWIMKTLFIAVTLYLFINILYMQRNLSIDNTDFMQVIFFIILFFLIINEWQKAIEDAERKKTQLEMNRLYYDAYDELILLIRERQHDMKNHISAILGMIYTIDNYDELVESQKKYCDDVIEKNKETKLLLSIGNPLIAGFLYRKYQEAQKQQITIECKSATSGNDYFVPEYELIEFLGILIDNAIDALNANTLADKRIYVQINDREQELSILVANISRHYDMNEIGKFFQKDFTSKGKGHGIGLTKLRKMVKSRDGDIIVTNENFFGKNFLQFCIILPKKK